MMVRYGRLGAGGVPNARLDRSEALRYLGYTGQQVDEAVGVSQRDHDRRHEHHGAADPFQ